MPENKPDKAARMAALESAKADRDTAEQRLAELLGQVEQARVDAATAVAAHELMEQEATSEEREAARVNAEQNAARHRSICAAHRENIEARKGGPAFRGAGGHVEPIDHKTIRVMTIDDKTHHVVSAHGLKLGHRGFDPDGKPREASRYTGACKISVDAPHDELAHERFDQTREVDCKGCLAAIDTVAPSDYLTADEQLAHQRAKNEQRNRESNARARRQ